MLNKKIVASLDPGIRRVVEWLDERGFDTCASGDGRSKPGKKREQEDGVTWAFDYPHVFMRVQPPKRLIYEANRLHRCLASIGIGSCNVGTPNGVWIQATYDPRNLTAVIELAGVDDELLQTVGEYRKAARFRKFSR